mmetsp:Transcript_54913/g.100568  ORF Transcript_54913/g.100568 Transcript_54913/m.100568 type:complete len:128 (+) Transcript_54913:630-1013(+)
MVHGSNHHHLRDPCRFRHRSPHFCSKEATPSRAALPEKVTGQQLETRQLLRPTGKTAGQSMELQAWVAQTTTWDTKEKCASPKSPWAGTVWYDFVAGISDSCSPRACRRLGRASTVRESKAVRKERS